LALAGLALLVLPALAWQWSSQGWFGFFVLRLPFLHPPAWDFLAGFWAQDLARPLSLALAGALAGLALLWADRTPAGRARAWFYGQLFLSLVLMAWSGRAHSLGGRNTLLPAYAGLALLAPLALHLLPARLAGLARPELVAAVGRAALAIQFLGLAYNPLAALPDEERLVKWREYVAFLRLLGQPVLVPHQRSVPSLAGQPSFGLEQAFLDLLRARDQAAIEPVLKELRGQLGQRRYAAVVTIRDKPLPYLEEGYAPQGTILEPEATYQRGNLIPWPNRLYLPRPRPPQSE
jgi:hypothetical protein